MTEQANWRGQRGARQPAVRHRWQREQFLAGGALGPSRRGRRVRVAVWLAMFLAALGVFVYFLLFLPIRTPVIGVVAGPYQWPYPPNAWAREDLAGLSPMDGQTLSITDTSAAWQSVDGGLQSLEQQLRDSREQAAECGVVVLSVSILGAVDATGAPCLVLPRSSPHDAQTWLPIRRLLEAVREAELPPDVHKLIILDAGQMLVNWNIGLLENSFAAQLEEAVAEADIPNLVILNSASPGQKGWAAPELQGSVFGYHLRRGLAGAADGVLSKHAPDGRVSLHELHAYLRRNVDDWVQRHRGARQQPLLVPSEVKDFQVTWSLNGRRRDQLESRAANVTRAAPAVRSAEITQLWRRRDALPASQLERFEPIAWHRLQHDLLWLEQATLAGSEYEMLARQTHVELKSRLDRLDRAHQAGQPTVDTEIETSTTSQANPSMPVHHLPLSALVGDSGGPTAASARAALTALQNAATADELDAALGTLASQQPLWEYDQIHFARLMAHHQIPRLWRIPGLMATVFKVRDQAAQAAINPDERVQFWIDAPLTTADSARRRGEDLLFLGPGPVQENPSTTWSMVATHYENVSQVSEDVAQSLRVRDRGWARTTYYAQWLIHPLHRHDVAYELEQTLLPLIENLHRLSRVLAAGPDEADPRLAELSQIRDKVEQQLETLDQQFQSSVQSLLKTSHPSAAVCREILAVLAVPLATAEQREQLYQKLVDFSGQFPSQNRFDSPESSASYDARLASFYTHPALAILDRGWLAGDDNALNRDDELASSARTRRIAQAGEHVRALLATLPAEIRAWRERFAVPTKGNDPQVFPFRAGWPQAELARIAASFSLPRLESDPVEQLRKLDLQRLLLRQSQRVLDDFYGPAAEGQQPFFEITANDYLRAAETIAETAPETERRLAALRALLQLRGQAARSALRTSGHPILFLNQSTDVHTHLSVKPRGAGTGLPSGQSAVFLRGERGRIPGSIHSLDVPLVHGGAVELDVVLSGANLDQLFSGNSTPAAQNKTEHAATGSPLTPTSPPIVVEAPRPIGADFPRPPVLLSAVTLFRGNEFRSQVPIDPAGGYLVEHIPETYSSASVNLTGAARQQLSVVFVLDCSNSMSEAVRIEAPREGDRPEQKTRMDVAKDALRAMLDRLAQDGNARVGVWFYGHRVGWTTTEPSRILRQVDYARTIPDGLSPNQDVEAIQHLGRFDGGIAAAIENLLPSVKPWGQTPLYHAVEQALGDFSGEDPHAKKILIVITDGLNYQYNAPNPTTQSDVLAAWSRQQVPIYIVGFGIPAEDVAEAYEQFTQLAEQTGGDYRTPAVNAASLIDSVESLLSPSSYRLTRKSLIPDAATGGPLKTARLGVPIDVDSLDDRPQEFVVEANEARQPITLWGGEALRLLLDDKTGEIRSVRYGEGNPLFVDLAVGTPPRPTGLVLGVHRPLQEGDGVRFTVSLQRVDEDFTPRPAECWIEITPVFPSGRTAPPVIFYQQHFEPGKPVPVLSWLVHGWPPDADRATVRFWCKPQTTLPNITLDAGSLLDESASAQGLLSNRSLEGITLSAHLVEGDPPTPATLQVIEQHSIEGAAFNPLKITAVLDDARLARVSRRIDPEHRLVVHRFAFTGVETKQLANTRLRITTPQELQRDAWHSERSVQVEVSDVTGLIDPTKDPSPLRPRLTVE